MSFLPSETTPTAFALAGLAALFIGISKAGFGGGLGMLTTPLCVLAFGAKDAIGILLPLLCAGDAFSLYHYWGKWEGKNLKYLLPGVFVGVLIGVHFVGRFSPRQLNIAIGVLALSFVLFQTVKEAVFRAEGALVPNHWLGVPCGIGAGVASSFAHGAGPVISLFLVPQRMAKEVYVGTTILVFTWINWIKLPFFFRNDIINGPTLIESARLFLFVPLGVWVGVWLNRKISERQFLKFVYVSITLTALQLILNINWARWFR